MRKYFMFAVVLCVFISAQQVKIELKELLVIGNDEDAGIEYIFKSPAKIKTDSRLNIFVQDYGKNYIQMFTPDGKFIKQFGKTGKGPGEIQDLTSFQIHDDEVIIVDLVLRRITKFNFRTDKYVIINTDAKKYLRYYKFFEYGNDFLVYNPERDIEPRYQLNIVDKNMVDVKSAFLKAKEVIDVSTPFYDANIGGPVSISIATFHNKLIAISKMFDPNEIVLIDKNDLFLPKKIKGRNFQYKTIEDDNVKDSHKYVEMQMKNKPIDGMYTFRNGPKGKFSVLFNNMSQNIFNYKEKYILHFYKCKIGSMRFQDAVDVFELNGKYLGYTVFREHDWAKLGKSIYYTYLHMDKDGNLYVSEEIDDIPVIKKYALTITEK